MGRRPIMGGATARGTALGAAFGVLVPVGILLWTVLIEPLPGPRHEALWLALSRILVAGYPTAYLVDVVAPTLQQSRAGLALYALLLIAVVVNWTLLGAIAGFTVGRIGRLRKGDAG